MAPRNEIQSEEQASDNYPRKSPSPVGQKEDSLCHGSDREAEQQEEIDPTVVDIEIFCSC
jgi:hypothetical protein